MRSLLKVLAATLLLVFAPLSAFAEVPPFPYQTVEQARIDGVEAGQGLCPSGPIPVFLLVRGDVRFRVFSTPDRDVFVRIDDDTATAVYLVLTKGDRLVVQKAMTVDVAKASYPGGPCQWLEEQIT